MLTRRGLVLLVLAALASSGATARAADPQSPVGVWQTIDDHTGKSAGLVRIFEVQGRLYGNVVSVLDPAKAGAVCVKCTDDRKDKPVLGLQIIRGLAWNGSDWSGGTILDPQTGEAYRCSMHVADGGRQLVVRGFIGISLFGRSQIWNRVG